MKIIDRMSLVKLQKTIGSGKFIKLLIENLTWLLINIDGRAIIQSLIRKLNLT